MDTVDRNILLNALDLVVHAIVRVDSVIEGPETPLTGFEIDAMDKAQFSLEAARSDLRALTGLGPSSDLPVGHPHRAETPPASTGSRRAT